MTDSAGKPQSPETDDDAFFRETRVCLVCRETFVVDTSRGPEAKRVYCDYKCKTRAQTIKRGLKEKGIDVNIRDYLRDNPQVRTVTPVMGKQKHADRIKAEVLTTQARADKAAHNAKEAEHNAAIAAVRKEELDQQREDRTAVNATVKALGLIPLADKQADILSGKKTFLAEQEIATLRTGISHVVNQHLVLADKVLSGEIQWSSAQVSLFKTLINKIVPDAATSKVASPKERKLSDLSVQELEQLVADQEEKAHKAATDEKVISEQ